MGTIGEYDEVIGRCRDLFIEKGKDYGTAWRILRLRSLTDQIFIKACRVRSIEDKGTRKVSDGVRGEFIGILNYSIMALIQLDRGIGFDMSVEESVASFDKNATEAKVLMEAKNHDYGEAWRDMRVSSFTDLILQKLLRIKQIEDNGGLAAVSEGVDAGYRDIINYAVFALIKLGPEA